MGKLLLLSFGLVLLLFVFSAPAEAGKTKNTIQAGKGRSGRGGRGRKVQKDPRARKARKQRKQRKNSQNQMRKGENSRRKDGGCSRQTTTFCPAEKALALKMLYGQVANFFRQLKRAENHAKIVSKKKGKKDNFESDAAILQEAVGGSFSAPSCASGRRSASVAGEKGQILANCTNSIGAACADITVNTSLLGDCKTKMEAYQTKITTCKTDDSCTCWTEATNMKSDITACKATDEMNRVKSLKSSCLDKFSDCKKAQDSAVELTASCPTTSVTTGAPSMTTMAAKHRALRDKLLARNLIKHLSA